MKSNTKLLIIFSLSIVLIFIGAISAMPKVQNRTDLEPFAKCITDSGAKFYGAYWCTHCQEQKKMFGTAKNLLPYVECSTADGKGQLPICTENNISGYPTWGFKDGSTLSGAVTLELLAEKTSCSLP